MAQKKTHTKCGGFHVSMFCLLSHFCLFCLIFSSFPLLLDFLKPKSGPLNEVIGYFLYLKVILNLLRLFLKSNLKRFLGKGVLLAAVSISRGLGLCLEGSSHILKALFQRSPYKPLQRVYHYTQKDDRINSKITSVREFLHRKYRTEFPKHFGRDSVIHCSHLLPTLTHSRNSSVR